MLTTAGKIQNGMVNHPKTLGAALASPAIIKDKARPRAPYNAQAFATFITRIRVLESVDYNKRYRKLRHPACWFARVVGVVEERCPHHQQIPARSEQA